MMVMSLRNGSSGARLPGDRSKARPNSAGAHMFFLMPNAVLPAEPCTISMAASRILPRAACAEARAGTMASRNGSAMVTPAALSTVRRDNCFWVRYIVSAPAGALKCAPTFLLPLTLDRFLLPLTLVHLCGPPLIAAFVRHAHIDGGAVYHANDVGRELIGFLAGVAHDGADRGQIRVFEPAAQRVRHQAFGETGEEQVRVLEQRLAQPGRAVHARAVVEIAHDVDRHLVVLDAVGAGDVEILERQAQDRKSTRL